MRPLRHHAALGRLQNARDDLQQRALAAAVGSHQAQRLALLHVKRDIAQRPEIGVQRPRAGQKLAQAVGGPAVKTIQLGNVFDEDQIRWYRAKPAASPASP